MRLSSLLAALVAVSAAVAPLASAQYRPAPAATNPPVQNPPPVMAPTPSPAPATAPAPTAAAATAPAAMPGYPGPSCVTPFYPGKAGSDEQILAFNRDFKTYGDCIRKYVDDARATSNAAIDAGNKAVTEYNKYADDVRKQIAADKAAK